MGQVEDRSLNLHQGLQSGWQGHSQASFAAFSGTLAVSWIGFELVPLLDAGITDGSLTSRTTMPAPALSLRSLGMNWISF